MKKIIGAISMALLTVILAFALAGCNTADKIKKAFEKEGYTITETTVEENKEAKAFLATLLKEDGLEDTNGYSVIVVSKALNSGVIIQFPSSDKLKSTLGDPVYDNAVESGFVKGDCYLVSVSPDVIKIFKNA